MLEIGHMPRKRFSKPSDYISKKPAAKGGRIEPIEGNRHYVRRDISGHFREVSESRGRSITPSSREGTTGEARNLRKATSHQLPPTDSETGRAHYTPKKTGKSTKAMTVFDMDSVTVKDVDGRRVVEIAYDQFAALLEEMETLEDSLAAIDAEADTEPSISFDEYLTRRGKSASGNA
jgi:hypothetical protein